MSGQRARRLHRQTAVPGELILVYRNTFVLPEYGILLRCRAGRRRVLGVRFGVQRPRLLARGYDVAQSGYRDHALAADPSSGHVGPGRHLPADQAVVQR